MPPSAAAGQTRVNTGWLAPAETSALGWLGPRVPSWITPNGLTAVGFAASVVALLGYLSSRDHPGALWLVNLALIANWFGDSLDGHVARLRGIERPRFGLFLDQSVDILSQLLFAAGLAGSGLVEPVIVAFAFAAYLMMTAQGLLRAQATGLFPLATGGMGLTEVRCLFLFGNVLFFFLPPRPFSLVGISVTYADLLGLQWIVVNVVLYVVTMVSQLRDLAEVEPPAGAPRAVTSGPPDEASPRSG
ncbi:MAG: CDP-alcohol phosphatidyltransferase family protein, partial [Alphaproteobacteria bacterium]|nr:CDP-alcohol phosphatidyltransferase family protein [Alphaproteobacteria bacterium]